MIHLKIFTRINPFSLHKNLIVVLHEHFSMNISHSSHCLWRHNISMPVLSCLLEYVRNSFVHQKNSRRLNKLRKTFVFSWMYGYRTLTNLVMICVLPFLILCVFSKFYPGRILNVTKPKKSTMWFRTVSKKING